jgi:hypothetical protein
MLSWPLAGYLDACGGGLHLQIGRTVSVDKTLGKASLNRDGSASFMLDPESLQDEVPGYVVMPSGALACVRCGSAC